MAAVLTKAAAAAVFANQASQRERLRYEGGGPGNTPLPSDGATAAADYARLMDALALVKADGAYAGLDAATKTAVDALAPFA